MVSVPVSAIPPETAVHVESAKFVARITTYLLEDAMPAASQASTGKVELRTSLWYDGVCLEELRRPAPAGAEGVAEVLAQALEARVAEHLG